MEHKNARKRLIYSLIIFTLALVIANIFTSPGNNEGTDNKKKSTSIQQIDSVFQLVLTNFDIDPAWIKRIKVNRRLFDSLEVQHKISLPANISTIEFIAELNSRLNFIDTKLSASEEKIDGDSEVKIYADGTLKYWASLLRDSKIKHVKGSFVFLVTEVSNLNAKQSEELFHSPFPFGVLFIPSRENEFLKDLCIDKGKEYSIILNDETTEDIFKLDPDYKKMRLRNSVINIINNFGGAVNIYIDKNCDIYNSTSYNFVQEEFKKRGKELKLISTLNKLDGESAEDLKSLFDFYYQSLSKNDLKILLTTAENYLILQPQINFIVKKGYKVLRPSNAEI